MRLTFVLVTVATAFSILISSTSAESDSSSNKSLSARDLASICPISDDGKFKCVSDTQFVLCLGTRTVVQNMAAGAPCVDGLPHSAPAANSAVSQAPSSSSPPPPPPPPAPSSSSSTTPPPPSSPAPKPSYTPLATTGPDPNFDPVHKGTRTDQTFNCVKGVKQLGMDTLNGFLYCPDKTHYTTCQDKGSTPLYAVAQGSMCQQLKNGDFIIAGPNGNPV